MSIPMPYGLLDNVGVIAVTCKTVVAGAPDVSTTTAAFVLRLGTIDATIVLEF